MPHNFSIDLILAQMMLGLSVGVFYAMLSLACVLIFRRGVIGELARLLRPRSSNRYLA